MKPLVIILNGYPQSGKDVFCEFASKKYNCINHSTVDTVKGFALKMGWDGEKNAHSRNMLSDFKDFYTKWFNGPFKEIVKLIKFQVEYNKDKNKPYKRTKFIFLHIREPKEIGKVKEWCKENDVICYAVFINRKSAIGKQSCYADREVIMFTYDHIINNNSSLQIYEKTVMDFLKNIINQ